LSEGDLLSKLETLFMEREAFYLKGKRR